MADRTKGAPRTFTSLEEFQDAYSLTSEADRLKKDPAEFGAALAEEILGKLHATQKRNVKANEK